MLNKLVFLAPLAALLVTACGHKHQASHSEKKAALIDAHSNAVFVDDDSETTDETVVIEATPSLIPRTAAHPARAPISFTRG